MNIQALGQKIKDLRAKKDLSQDELAAKSGVARRLIQRLEKGKGNPTLGTILAISSFFGEAPSSFIEVANEAKALPDFALAGEMLIGLSTFDSDIQLILQALILRRDELLAERPDLALIHKSLKRLLKIL